MEVERKEKTNRGFKQEAKQTGGEYRILQKVEAYIDGIVYIWNVYKGLLCWKLVHWCSTIRGGMKPQEVGPMGGCKITV